MSAPHLTADLRELREAKVLTQAELGSQCHVSAFERGKKMPGPHFTKAMARKLGVDPEVVHAACRESCRRASATRPSTPKRARRTKGG